MYKLIDNKNYKIYFFNSYQFILYLNGILILFKIAIFY